MTPTVWLLIVSADEYRLVDSQVFDGLKLLFVLAGVLVLAYVAVRYVVPRMTGVRPVPAGPMRVVARLPLEPGKNLYIVKAGDSHFLLGTSANDVHLLAPLGQDVILDQPVASEVKGIEFGRLLKSLQGRRD